MENKISIIVPVYNVEKHLEKCLNSLIIQTHKNLEIILIDDGSTDSSGKICDSFSHKDKRIIVKHISNSGQANARNIGLDMAKGDYISFVDSDDWIEPTMIEELLGVCVNNNVLVSSCNVNFISNKMQKKKFDIFRKEVEILFFADIISGLLTQEKVRFEVWNKLYKAELLRNIRFKTGQLHEEVFFDKLVFFNIEKLAFINKKLYNYNLIREGNTASSFKESKLCIFDEFGSFTDELIEKNFNKEAEIIRAIAIEFSINMFYHARQKRVNKSIEKRIISEFRKYYKQGKTNEHINKKKAAIFNVSPSLYYQIARIKNLIY